MATIKYNSRLGNYTVSINGKKFTHAKLSSAEEQVKAYLRVQRKRASRRK